MPKVRIPFSHKSDSDDVEAPNQEGTHVSFGLESMPFDKISLASNGRAQMLTGLMNATKNPSTVFTPPFGTSAGEHHSRLGEHTQHLWQYNKITDLTVKLEGVQYPCHKTVLSCYSKYFKELLLDQKGSVNVIHLRLSGVTNIAFEVLLTYMYTSDLNLTCQNIGEVYTAARKLGIDGALILCTSILTGKKKHDVHSVYVYVTAKKQRLNDCAAKALKIMTRRFEQIAGTPEFLDLDFQQVKEYLSQDVLATRSEVIVYLAALKWLSVKFFEREEYAADLLNCVRFQMMTLNEVLACFSPPLLPGILEHKEITDKLLAATCYVAAVTVNEEKRFERFACRPRRYLLHREAIILWDPSIFDPDRHAMYVEEMAATTIQAVYRGYKARKSIEADKAAGILAPPEIGTFYKSNLAGMDEFEPPKDKDDETYIPNGPQSEGGWMNRIRKSVVSYISGSEDGKEKSEENQTEKVDQEDEDDILPVTPATAPSRSSSVETLVSHVNDMAEHTEIKKYTSDKRIDMSSEAFKQTFPHPSHETVHEARREPSTESDETGSSSSDSQERQSNNSARILVTGGYRSNGTEDQYEGKKMFLYDPFRNNWQRYGEMGKARHHHCLLNLNEEIYFIGGCSPSKTKADKMTPQKACYKLDLQSKSWTKISKMRHSRMYHGVAEVGGKIYVIGGRDDKERLLKSVEVYSPESDKWEELETPLETPTMGVAVCVHQGKIWVAGGMIQDDDGKIELLNEVKYYDPEKAKWSYSLGQLPSARAFSRIVSFENEVFLIGGTSQSEEEDFLSTCDVLFYDSKVKRWIPTTYLPFARHFVEAAVIGPSLYVLGGLSSFQEKAPDEVIIYEKGTREWLLCKPFPESLCGFAAISITEAP